MEAPFDGLLTISFVFINLHICWPRERKRSIGMPPPQKEIIIIIIIIIIIMVIELSGVQFREKSSE